MKIAFVGAGIMGRPMLLNLKKAGHELIVPERKSLKDDVRAAATVVADAAAAAAAAEIIILMVPDTPDVEAALFGPKGVAEGLKPGEQVVVEGIQRVRPNIAVAPAPASPSPAGR